MRLERVIGIKTEVEYLLEKYRETYDVQIFESKDLLNDYLEENCTQRWAKTLLLIAATDATIFLGKQYGIATMAYMNPEIPNQTYSGVDMIVEGFEEVDANFLEKVYQRYHHLPWTIAETERCVIKELSLENLDDLFALYADEEMYRYTENLYPYEEEQEFQRAYINNMYRFYGYGMWLVFSKETGELIGRAGLEHREYDNQIELELGYVIGKKFQRRGYATEVCERIIEIAKCMTDFQRINCLVDADNIASIRLAEKLQFVHAEDMELNGKRLCRYVYKM